MNIMLLISQVRKLLHPGLLLAAFLTSCAATEGANQNIHVLLLPEDERSVDQLMRAGITEFPDLSGLSRVVVKDSETVYYVINRQNAVHKQIMGRLSRMPPQAYISISQDQGLLSRVVHLRLDERDSPVVIFQVFENPLLGQLGEIFSQARSYEETTTVEFVEYGFPVKDCDGLADPIATVESSLREAVNRIGLKPALRDGEFQEIMVDGPHYDVQVRMETLIGNFPVGGNSGAVFGSIQTLMDAVRNCSQDRGGAARNLEFYGMHDSSLVNRQHA
jgi:hypothetical protein